MAQLNAFSRARSRASLYLRCHDPPLRQDERRRQRLRRRQCARDAVRADGRSGARHRRPRDRRGLRPADRHRAVTRPADAFMRVWNADGGAVETCGNALRCVGWMLMQSTGRTRRRDRHPRRPARPRPRGPSGRITVDMGAPRLDWDRDPAGRGDGHPRHRAAGRPDRRSGAAHAGRRLHGQSARRLLHGPRAERRLRARHRLADRAPPAASRKASTSASPTSSRPTTSACGSGSAAPA